MTAISDKYLQLGGANGLLGPALTPELGAANGGLKQDFQNGSIYWQAATGAHEVHGLIRAKWLALGGEESFVGYPTSDETAARDTVGRFNQFQGAVVFWHPDTGAFELHGLILARWNEMGSESSVLGYPATDETATADGVGRFNHFEHGSIFWTPVTGAHEVLGAIRLRWAELRWERGLLGYPIAAPYAEVRNRVRFDVSRFQSGKIEVNTETQQVAVAKAPSTAAPNFVVPIAAFRVADADGGPAERGVRQGWRLQTNVKT